MEKIKLLISEQLANDFLEFTKNVRTLENVLKGTWVFKDNANQHYFKSARLTTAYNKLVEARMMCGDILRMVGIEKPYENSYNGISLLEKPKYLDLIKLPSITDYWEPKITSELEHLDEVKALGIIRSELGKLDNHDALFNRALDLTWKVQAQTAFTDRTWEELKVYCDILCQALKLANCYLGLRFGELFE